MNILSLGAGIQSSTLLLKSYYDEMPMIDCAIFADTGYEPKQVYLHLEKLIELVKNKIEVFKVSYGNIKDDYIKSQKNPNSYVRSMPIFIKYKNGSMGKLRYRQCTESYKIVPIQKKIRELLGYKKGERISKEVNVNMQIGISMDEIIRMKPSREKWITKTYPLIDANINRRDCIEYLNGLGINSPKSSCICCPFHDNNYWKEMKNKTPEEFNDAVDFDKNILRNIFPGLKGKAYIHRSGKALDEIDFNSQLSLIEYGEECEGMCGI